MKRLSRSLLIFALFTFSAALLAQPITILKPRPATNPTGDEAACVDVSNQLRLCKEIKEGNNSFSFLYNQQVVKQWNPMGFAADKDSYEVLLLDLDGNGSQEIVVVNFDGTSNGLGVQYRTIYIFAPPQAGQISDPVSLSIEEYGARGTFIKQPLGYHIFATQWQASDDLERKRKIKGGLYLIGKWIQYRQGKLEFVNKPVWVRRYLKQFERERLASLDRANTRAPYSWFTQGKGKEVIFDPQIQGREMSSMTGVITALTEEKYKRPDADADEQGNVNVVLTIKLDSGKTIQCIQGNSEEYPSAIPEVKYFDAFGLLPAERVIPKNTHPKYFLNQLIGKKVRIVNYQQPEYEPTRLLWLETEK